MPAGGSERSQESSRSESCLSVFALFVLFDPYVRHWLYLTRIAQLRRPTQNFKAEDCKTEHPSSALNHLESAAAPVSCSGDRKNSSPNETDHHTSRLARDRWRALFCGGAGYRPV